MRSLKRNQRLMHYALYDNEIQIVDENGNEELETRAGYKNPVLFRAHLTLGKSNNPWLSLVFPADCVMLSQETVERFAFRMVKNT